MTVEQRFEYMEKLHAEHVEMARQDRAAHIAWKREMESQVQATWTAFDRFTKQASETAARHDQEWAEMKREQAERDRVTDKRIGDLVSAIGKLIERLPPPA